MAKSIGREGCACHWRSVDTRSVAWPGTTKSQAWATISSAGFQARWPPELSTTPPKPTG